MKAYLYKLPNANLSTWDGTDPASVFEVIRGQPGGLAELPEPCGFQEDLEVLMIRPGYWHPERGERVFFPLPLGDQQPPEITYSVMEYPGGHKTEPETLRPEIQWYIDVDVDAYEAREAAKVEAREAKEAQEAAYSYAVARGRDYTQQFSKAPHPNSADAIGHVLDALLEWVDQHEVTPALQAILDKRAEIKARHPKP